MTWCFIRCQNLGVMTSQPLVRLGGVAANSPRPGVSSVSSLSVPECAVGMAIFYVSCCIIFPGLGQQITIKLVLKIAGIRSLTVPEAGSSNSRCRWGHAPLEAAGRTPSHLFSLGWLRAATLPCLWPLHSRLCLCLPRPSPLCVFCVS